MAEQTHRDGRQCRRARSIIRSRPRSASTPPQWIALAMVAVFAIIIWKRVPALIGAALDKKIAAIRAQLDEAAQLRAEAEALKAEYEAKAAAADAERATMLERARAEAEAIVAPGQGRHRRPDRAPHPHGRGQDRRRRARRHRRGPRPGRPRRRRRRRSLISEEMDAGADKALVDRTIEGLTRAH